MDGSIPKPPSGTSIPAFPLTQGNVSQFVPLSARNTLVLSGGGGTLYGTRNIGLPAFSIRGTTAFAAYGTNEIVTNQYGIGQLGFLRSLVQLPPFLGGKMYLATRFEAGTYQRSDTPLGQPAQSRKPADVLAGVIVNTIFGPVLIGGAAGDAGHHRFFSLGRVF